MDALALRPVSVRRHPLAPGAICISSSPVLPAGHTWLQLSAPVTSPRSVSGPPPLSEEAEVETGAPPGLQQLHVVVDLERRPQLDAQTAEHVHSREHQQGSAVHALANGGRRVAGIQTGREGRGAVQQ